MFLYAMTCFFVLISWERDFWKPYLLCLLNPIRLTRLMDRANFVSADWVIRWLRSKWLCMARVFFRSVTFQLYFMCMNPYNFKKLVKRHSYSFPIPRTLDLNFVLYFSKLWRTIWTFEICEGTLKIFNIISNPSLIESHVEYGWKENDIYICFFEYLY